MALNDRRAGGGPADGERDPGLDRLYREGGGETPPARLDAAILAAARREVGARPLPLSAGLRRWRVPVAIAAVVVLSVTLVTLVREEGGDRLIEIPLVAPPPALKREASVSAPGAMAEPDHADRSTQQRPERPAAPAASGPAVADTAAGRALEPFPGRQERQPPPAAMAQVPHAASQATPDSPARPSPAPSARARDDAVGIRGMASSVEERQPVARASESPAVAREGESAMVGRAMPSPPAPVPPSAKPVSRPAPKAAAPDPLRSTGAADSAAYLKRPPIWSDLEQQPPEKWLERIEELRQAGRAAEVNDMLAEFRKRFPDHPLPAWAR